VYTDALFSALQISFNYQLTHEYSVHFGDFREPIGFHLFSLCFIYVGTLRLV